MVKKNPGMLFWVCLFGFVQTDRGGKGKQARASRRRSNAQNRGAPRYSARTSRLGCSRAGPPASPGPAPRRRCGGTGGGTGGCRQSSAVTCTRAPTRRGPGPGSPARSRRSASSRRSGSGARAVWPHREAPARGAGRWSWSHKHTRARAHARTHPHPHTHTKTHAHIRTQHTHTYHRHTHTHACTHAHTHHTHTHTHAHAHIRTHAQTHMRIVVPQLSLQFIVRVLPTLYTGKVSASCIEKRELQVSVIFTHQKRPSSVVVGRWCDCVDVTSPETELVVVITNTHPAK